MKPADATAAARTPLARLIALYLPQYHPIPENDLWWGAGFTEWTNTAKAKPLFPGHYQPHVPADLGFYDLRVPESRAAQAALAREHGIEAFCYYHYWFAGRRVLERPFNEVLASGEPDFPFCLCWANESWTGIWHGASNRVLIAQTYPGIDDHRAHFDTLLPAFRDPRYLRVNDKPFFAIYRPMEIPQVREFTDLWRRWAVEAGLKGLHLVGVETILYPDWNHRAYGFDASFQANLPGRRPWIRWRGHPGRVAMQAFDQGVQRLTGRPTRRSYGPSTYRFADVSLNFVADHLPGLERYPCVIPNWDNTPRIGKLGLVVHDSTPDLFRAQLRKALATNADLAPEHQIVIVKSWNEWAEGNHLEPDLRYGHAYLDVVREEIVRSTAQPAENDTDARDPPADRDVTDFSNRNTAAS